MRASGISAPGGTTRGRTTGAGPGVDDRIRGGLTGVYDRERPKGGLTPVDTVRALDPDEEIAHERLRVSNFWNFDFAPGDIVNESSLMTSPSFASIVQFSWL